MHKVSLYKRGDIFWVRYSKDGRQVQKTLRTRNRKVAEDKRAEIEYRLRRGELQERGPVLVEPFIQAYEGYCKAEKAEKTWRTDKGRIDHFVETVKVTDFSKVTTKQVSDYVFGMVKRNGEPASSTYRLRIRETLHAMYSWGLELGYFDLNPVSKVRRPRPEERPIRYLDQKQIEEMLEAIEGQLIEPFARTVLFAGLRRGEACWLTWDDVALKGNKPILKIQTKKVDGHFWRPKTRRDRVVPVSSRLLSSLRRLRKNGTPWVFVGPGETRWGEDWATSMFRKAMKDADLPWNFLDLRHTFGSQLAQKGVSLFKISKILGNSPEICRRHYAALVPEDMHDEVEF